MSQLLIKLDDHVISTSVYFLDPALQGLLKPKNVTNLPLRKITLTFGQRMDLRVRTSPKEADQC
jgi:hypothetical protein